MDESAKTSDTSKSKVTEIHLYFLTFAAQEETAGTIILELTLDIGQHGPVYFLKLNIPIFIGILKCM